MFNRNKRQQARACEPVPESEAAEEADIGLIGCGLCRDFVGAIVERRYGFTRVVGLQCLNCEMTIPVGDGFVVYRSSPTSDAGDAA